MKRIFLSGGFVEKEDVILNVIIISSIFIQFRFVEFVD